MAIPMPTPPIVATFETMTSCNSSKHPFGLMILGACRSKKKPHYQTLNQLSRLRLYLFLSHLEDALSAAFDVGEAAGVGDGAVGGGEGRVHPVPVLLGAAAFELGRNERKVLGGVV